MKKDRFAIEVERFGRIVKKIRLNKKMTQLDLAEEMNVERSEISKIENGKLNIEFRTITKLATALDVELREFFGSIDS